MKKAYKFRFYPTDEQSVVLARTFGSVRHVWNWALALRTREYRTTKRSLGYYDLWSLLTEHKKSSDTK